MTTTPWGKAERRAMARVDQRAGERRFSTIVELLESAAGQHLVRIAYATDGSARRGPVTLRAQDLARLRKAVLGDPLLRQALLGEPGEPDADATAVRRRGRAAKPGAT